MTPYLIPRQPWYTRRSFNNGILIDPVPPWGTIIPNWSNLYSHPSPLSEHSARITSKNQNTLTCLQAMANQYQRLSNGHNLCH